MRYLKTAIYILPFVFVVHNIEEILFMEKWTLKNPDSLYPQVTTLQFAIAVLLFSILGILVVYLKSVFKTEKLHLNFMLGFTGMIFLNVFTHIAGAIFSKGYVPGLITGLILNLPLTFYILFNSHKQFKISFKQIAIDCISGGVAGLILVFVFLKIGYLLTLLYGNYI